MQRSPLTHLRRLVTKKLKIIKHKSSKPAGKPLRRSLDTTDTRHRPGDPGSSKEACCPLPGCTCSRSCGSSHLVSGTNLFLGAVHMHSGRDFGRLLVQCQEHVARFEIETFARLFRISSSESERWFWCVSCFWWLHMKRERKIKERSTAHAGGARTQEIYVCK